MTAQARTQDAERLRARLRGIAARRVEVADVIEELAEETREAIVQSKGVLRMTEVASLLDLERSAMYRTYVG